MIEKVSKLKTFGIFRDFTWSNDIPNLAQFNLIYGSNKSGKTTFSRIFSACEKKTTEFAQYPSGGEFNIQLKNGATINQSNCKASTEQIRVFNEDFIDENVSFDPTNPSKPIVYVSEPDIKISNKLRELRNQVDSLTENLKSIKKVRKKSEKVEDNFRKTTARTIKDMVGNLESNDKYRDYNKGDLQDIVKKIGVSKFTQLSDDDYTIQKKLIRSEPLKFQAHLKIEDLEFSFGGIKLTSISNIHRTLSKLLGRKVMAESIDRFKDDPELNKWAQHGFELHSTKGEIEKCLFCQNKFPKDFLKSLAKHFSDDYENLQSEISSVIQEFSDMERETIDEKKVLLYGDLQNDFEKKLKNLNIVEHELNLWINESIKLLKEKFDNPLLNVVVQTSPKNFKTDLDEAIREVNKIIKQHNSKAENHETEVAKAKDDLEKHLIALAVKEVDYKSILEDFDKNIKAENSAIDDLEKNEQEILELEKETSEIGSAINIINYHLELFFGRKEIHLELDDTKKGYVIKRNGDVAQNLSQSEKNVIAFSYFIAKSSEQGLNIKDGIFVIDDPISSFDSNFIYHCFSLIKNHFKESEQLIITTHNFELFNLVKYWYEHKISSVNSYNRKLPQGVNGKPSPCEFYMVENIIENDKRCASIAPLDKTLRDFKSEYHFLFARLSGFLDKSTPNYADFYTIGNIARRFLEIYVNFKIPKSGDLRSKVDQLDSTSINNTDKDKVYKLIQEHSHGFDPASAIEHKDKGEIESAIKILMKMIEQSDKKHFESLKSVLE